MSGRMSRETERERQAMEEWAAGLEAYSGKLLALLLDCWCQWAYDDRRGMDANDGNPPRFTGGLSVLEDLYDTLFYAGLITPDGRVDALICCPDCTCRPGTNRSDVNVLAPCPKCGPGE